MSISKENTKRINKRNYSIQKVKRPKKSNIRKVPKEPPIISKPKIYNYLQKGRENYSRKKKTASRGQKQKRKRKKRKREEEGRTERQKRENNKKDLNKTKKEGENFRSPPKN